MSSGKQLLGVQFCSVGMFETVIEATANKRAGHFAVSILPMSIFGPINLLCVLFSVSVSLLTTLLRLCKLVNKNYT